MASGINATAPAVDDVVLEVEKTPLYYELLDVMANCDKKSQIAWVAIIHLDDAGTLYYPTQVTDITLRRDYVDGFADEVCVTCSIPLGKFARQVYPNRSHLQMTLQKWPIKENSTEIDWDAVIETEKFSATLIEEGPAVAQIQGQETKDEYALDLVSILEVRFQIFNKAVERIRITTVGGIYRHVTVKNLMLTLMTDIATRIKVDNRRVIEGVDMIPTNNESMYEQMVLTTGLRISDLPFYLQKRYGVYSAGLGAYIQNKHWYVYSLYDTNRFTKTLRTLTIYILPKRKYPEIERTYRVKKNSVSILCISNSDFRGDNEISYTIQGNGVRFTEAENVMDGFGKSGGNKMIVSRKKNNNEFSAVIKEDGVNFAPVTDRRITANPFVHFTELAAKKGGILRLNWENSDPQLVEPGMVTRIVYFDDDVLKEAYANVLGLVHMSVKVGDHQTKKHTQQSQIVLFTNLKKANQ